MNSRLQIQCPTSQLIHVFSAYYGLQPATNTNYCAVNSYGGPALCYRPNSFSIVASSCQGRNNCSLTITSSRFGDLCLPYTNNQLMVQYQCVDTAAYSAISACPINSTALSICPALTDLSTQSARLWCDPDVMTIQCSAGQVIQIVSCVCVCVCVCVCMCVLCLKIFAFLRK